MRNKPLTTTREPQFIAHQDEVRNILDGSQSQFRRVITHRYPSYDTPESMCKYKLVRFDGEFVYFRDYLSHTTPIRCPYGRPGDRLWVRETFAENAGDILYRADGEYAQPGDCTAFEEGDKWRPSIFMPRDFSRITLEVTAVRVERVQEIWTRSLAFDELFKEGVPQSAEWDRNGGLPTPLSLFIKRWDSINAKRGYSWESNPWVWVVEFKG